MSILNKVKLNKDPLLLLRKQRIGPPNKTREKNFGGEGEHI